MASKVAILMQSSAKLWSRVGRWNRSTLSARPVGALVEPLERRSLLSGNFPLDAGMFNVKTSYGAYGDGIHDDTTAIQNAINAALASSWDGRMVYLPNGNYRVSNSLSLGANASNLILQGQSRLGVAIKLSDATGGFTNASTPKPLLNMFTGGSTGNAFGNSVRDLTLDIGANNPGAIGINWMNNNQGTLQDVTIKSSDASHRGVYGLNLKMAWPGPMLAKNVLIDGFNFAVYNGYRGNPWGSYDYSQTFEHLTIQNQQVEGISNSNGAMHFRDLRSINSVPAVDNSSDSGQMEIIDSSFIGGASGNAGIANTNFMFLRNVTFGGYGTSVAGQSLGSIIGEWSSEAPKSLFPTNAQSLNLPIEETPATPEDDPSTWVKVNGTDATAVQNAINTANSLGRSTVYFAKGTYTIANTIVVSAGIRRIIGMGAVFNVAGSLASSSNPVFKLDNSLSGTSLTFERFVTGYSGSRSFYWFEDNSSKPVILKNFILNDGAAYRNNASFKKLYIEDVCGNGWDFSNGQYIWARQLNPESHDRTNIVNNAATFWALGLKMEYTQTLLDNQNGATSEIIGAFSYGIGEPVGPLFINNNSSLSLSTSRGWGTDIVRETRGSVTYSLSPDKLSGMGMKKLPLYVGYIKPEAPADLSASPASINQINLTWLDNSNNETIQNLDRSTNTTFTQNLKTIMLKANTTAYSDTDLAGNTTYYYRVRATNGAGDSGNSNTVSARISVPTVTAPPIVNNGNVQRSAIKNLTVIFSVPVTVNPVAWRLIRRSDSLAVSVLATNPSLDGRTYLLSFTTGTLASESLNDGVYDLTIKAGQASTSYGTTLATDYLFSFFRLYGDYDGNGTVNNTDYGWFKRTFNQSTGNINYLWFMDYDGNSTINNTDFGWFKRNFGKTLIL